MPISRVTARWTGFQGAPGYSNFHFQSSTSEPSAVADRALVHSFFDTLSNQLASTVTITVNPTIEILDSETGSLIDYVDDDTELSTVSGGTTSTYSASSGAVINWQTNGVRNGRRIRGRTFIVPLRGGAYESNGTLSGATIDTLSAAASVLSGAGFGSGFGILSRSGGGGPIGFAEVTGHRIPDMAAVLRSRRD